MTVELRTSAGTPYTAGLPVPVELRSSSPTAEFSLGQGGPWTTTLTDIDPLRPESDDLLRPRHDRGHGRHRGRVAGQNGRDASPNGDRHDAAGNDDRLGADRDGDDTTPDDLFCRQRAGLPLRMLTRRRRRASPAVPPSPASLHAATTRRRRTTHGDRARDRRRRRDADAVPAARAPSSGLVTRRCSAPVSARLGRSATSLRRRLGGGGQCPSSRRYRPAPSDPVAVVPQPRVSVAAPALRALTAAPVAVARSGRMATFSIRFWVSERARLRAVVTPLRSTRPLALRRGTILAGTGWPPPGRLVTTTVARAARMYCTHGWAPSGSFVVAPISCGSRPWRPTAERAR